MPGPLSHIRVLDLSRILAAPTATQYLADMGAEVIKIERPGEGDDTRGWGPPFVVEPSEGRAGLSTYYASANRGKRSVTVDFTTPEGQEIVRKLVTMSDVVIENYKVGGLAKYGLDYNAVAKLNPKVIYCSVTGFGQTGPYAPRAGYDFLIQGMGGLMSITGERDDLPGGGPQKLGVAISDLLAGWNAVSSILTALIKRDRTGEGEYIDISLLDCTVAALVNQASYYLVSGKVPGRMGNAHASVIPYQVFATADGHMILAIGNDRQFKVFCEIAGIPHLAEDPRFKTMRARIENRPHLIPEVAAAIARRTTDTWMAQLEAAAVPCGPINTIDRVFADPQVQARGMVRELTEGAIAPYRAVANPVKLASGDTTGPKAPPLLGEDNETVLAGLLGMTADEIAGLKSRGIV